MGRTLSVVLLDCSTNETERGVVFSLKKVYKRFDDNIYRQRKRNEPNKLFDKMNSYHSNIKLTI